MPALVSTVVLLAQARPLRQLRPLFDRRAVSMLSPAFSLGLASVFVLLYYNADTILLGLFKGAETAGWYAAAYRVVLAALAVPIAAHAVLLPIYARLLGTDSTKIAPLAQASLQGLLMIALPFAIGCSVAAQAIVGLLFGPSYGPSAGPLAILSWTAVTVTLNAPFAALMLAEGRDRRYLLITELGAALNLSFNVILIPVFGMVGAALVTVAHEIVVLGLIAWSTRGVSSGILRRALVPFIIPSLVMSVVLGASGGTLVGLIAGSLLFLVLAVVVGAAPVSSSQIGAVLHRRHPS